MDKLMTLAELKHEQAFLKFLEDEYVRVYGPVEDGWAMHKLIFNSGARRAKEWLEKNTCKE